MEQLKDVTKRRDAENALAEIVGRKISIKLTPLDPAADPEGAATPRRRKHRGVPHIVEEAMEMFDGEVVD
jgi:hypothetical protein